MIGLLGQNDPWRTRKVQMHRGWNWLRHSCPVLSGFWAKSLPRCRAVSKTATSPTYRCAPMEETCHIVTSSHHFRITSCLVPQREKMLMRRARTGLNPASWVINGQLHEPSHGVPTKARPGIGPSATNVVIHELLVHKTWYTQNTWCFPCRNHVFWALLLVKVN